MAKTFGFRLTAEESSNALAVLKEFAPASERAAQALRAITQASPQLASVQDGVQAKIRQTAAAMREATDRASGFQRVLSGLSGVPGSGIANAFATGGAFAVGMQAASAAITAVVDGAKAIPAAGDQARASIARLSATIGDMGQAAKVFQELQSLSRQTGIAVSDTAGTFQRFSIAAKDIGATNAQVLDLVGGLQKFAIVSGASVQETGAATQQLAQALASGKLQGDELRSILENMPLFAQALARELGTSIGALREMGAEGKLTADVVFPAMLRAVQGVDDVFGKMPVTLARAQQQFDAAATSFLAHLDQALGVSDKLIASLRVASGLVDAVRRIGGGSTDAERERSLQGDLTDTLARIQEARGRPNTGRLQIQLEKRAEEVRSQLLQINNERVRREEAEYEASQETRLASERAGLQKSSDELRKKLDKDFAARKEYDDRIKELNRARNTGALSETDFTNLSALALKDRDEALKKMAGGAKAAAGSVKELADYTGEAEKVLTKLREKQQDMASSIEAELDPVAAAYQRVAEQIRKVQESVALGFIDPERGETLIGNANAGLEKALKNIENQGERADETFSRFFANAASGFEQSIVKGEKLGTVMQSLAEDVARLILRLTVTEPLLKGLKDSGIGSSISGVFSNLFSGLFSGGASVSGSMGVSIGGPQPPLPFAMGGIMTPRGAVPLNRYAGGGVANSPQLALFGEGRTPEAFVPLPDGRSIPVSMRGGGGTVQNVTVNVGSSNASPALIAAAVQQGMAQVKAEMIDETNRGGAMARTFGRRRA